FDRNSDGVGDRASRIDTRRQKLLSILGCGGHAERYRLERLLAETQAPSHSRGQAVAAANRVHYSFKRQRLQPPDRVRRRDPYGFLALRDDNPLRAATVEL